MMMWWRVRCYDKGVRARFGQMEDTQNLRNDAYVYPVEYSSIGGTLVMPI